MCDHIVESPFKVAPDSFIVDGTPQKRLFRSIIADYGLLTSICELIDNAIDHWTASGRQRTLLIQLFLNADRQLIAIRDNAGGVPRSDIQLLVSPGASRDEAGHQFIGNFGVGGKRAGIALGQRVEVTSRHGEGETLRFVLSDDWLTQDTWEVEVERVPEIEPGSTNVSISSLRQGFSFSDIDALGRRLAEIYANFVGENCDIRLNGNSVGRTKFDNWAYPPEHRPKISNFAISPSEDGTTVAVRLSAGLIQDREPKEGNYGVYIYCNDRLILAHEKSHEVGFYKGEAGVPHPDASLARTIVEINGAPELMPWTSNKSGINWSHPTFLEIRSRIVSLNAHFVKVSRRLKNEREEKVYAHQKGEMEEISLDHKESYKKVVDLPLPRGRRKAYSERIIDENAGITLSKPWTLGLVEAMGVADTIARKRLHTKNRIGLIILDSNLEIALKEFIVHRVDLYPPQKIRTLNFLSCSRKGMR
ncbi:ATP-binding protein [Pseudophaeobacter sp. A-200-2]|uniref:ATP-binding protein n=1 Tax=Pseudophaeobacter sp. A-200-2 TaxID=3098145 RepID=UPI0034D54406